MGCASSVHAGGDMTSMQGIIEHAKKNGGKLNLASTAGSEEDDEGLLQKNHLDPLSAIPEAVFDCTAITALYLKQNQLTEIPAAISKLVNLTDLNVSENSLTELPPQIGELAALETLDISENQIKALPVEIGKCTSLTTFIAFKNSLSKLPEEIGGCVSLIEVNFFNNKLIRLPKSMSGLTKMENLNAGGNKLKTLPSTDNWTAMTEFKCHQNNLVMLPSFAKMTALDFLKMDMNRALRELPDFGTELTSLTHLECNMCDLESLPDDIKSMTGLKTLNVQSNRIPALPEISLPELDIFNCSSNKITEIPNSIAQCTKLRVFFFNSNQVDELPSTLGSLKGLERVMCGGNGLGPSSKDTLSKVSSICENNNGWLKN